MGIMNDNELLEWLMANGGPIIKYRTATELMEVTENLSKLQRDIIDTKTVASLLQRLEQYKPIEKMDIRTINAIHTGAGVEGIVAKLIELGMRVGIEAFDSRMEIFRQYVDNIFVKEGMQSHGGNDVKNTRAIFIASLIASYFVHAGYIYDEIIDYIKQRIDLLYKAALERQFDVLLKDSELSAYPKRVKSFEKYSVIKPEYDPGCCDKPLPFIHDIYCMAYLPSAFVDSDLEFKINKIMEYIFDERFQALPEGYGLLWYKANRTYYACGWKPQLPCYFNYDSELEKGMLVLNVELMSNFKNVRETKWFIDSINYLEQFRTSTGTYCFPQNLIKDKKDQGYVCGVSMGLGENRKSQRAFEIEATFRMLLIKKRAGLLNVGLF